MKVHPPLVSLTDDYARPSNSSPLRFPSYRQSLNQHDEFQEHDSEEDRGTADHP